MKLDTIQADSQRPFTEKIAKGYSDSLPAAFYSKWRAHLEENKNKWSFMEMEAHYRKMRQNIRWAMFRWLDAHDGVVDRWPLPILEDWSGIVFDLSRFRNSVKQETIKRKKFPFELFAPGPDNGFTSFKEPLINPLYTKRSQIRHAQGRKIHPQSPFSNSLTPKKGRLPPYYALQELRAARANT